MNQAVDFGLLLGGGVLLVSVFSGRSLGQVLSGQPATPTSTPTGGGGVITGAGKAITGALGTVVGKAGPGASRFTAAQQTFATTLSQDTGLDLNVIYAWMANEQPPGSAAAPNGTNNWLNIGSTDSGFYGASNPAWTDPAAAGAETASWLRGATAAGFGAASPGIRAILNTAGQSPALQISAIQHSGWASSGYPDLMSIYQGIAG